MWKRCLYKSYKRLQTSPFLCIDSTSYFIEILTCKQINTRINVVICRVEVVYQVLSHGLIHSMKSQILHVLLCSQCQFNIMHTNNILVKQIPSRKQHRHIFHDPNAWNQLHCQLSAMLASSLQVKIGRGKPNQQQEKSAILQPRVMKPTTYRNVVGLLSCYPLEREGGGGSIIVY